MGVAVFILETFGGYFEMQFDYSFINAAAFFGTAFYWKRLLGLNN
jgi:hypothetical protein